ncbi:hypothetical protein [Corallococcus macrosporus]|uniref:Uncharacterized protein n=1 Tax=Corallococcus macrosporus DSM 14697 TaxID=1189310 RepID=A0A250JP42_9BACT|nr:hypothetical protein [Corallococcus macrosporus]ATB45428.1 hypothetical protein MYMAC_001013 [Corallococcus macrosporus DSM 14697]
MSQYDDLFFRVSTSDTGDRNFGHESTDTIAYQSPDIIPYGTRPTTNPVQFFAGNYGSDVGQNLVESADNYIYLRARNLAGEARSGSVSLYAVPANLLLYPYLWAGNELQTSDKNVDNGALNVIQAGSGQIAVTDNPFVWRAPTPDHYCLVSRVSNATHPNPVPTAALGDMNALTEFILDNPGFGWRNVTIVDANKPDYTTKGIGFEQGTEDAMVTFDIKCVNVPAGASVAFSAGTPGPSPLIDLGETTVPQTSPDQNGNYNWHTGIDCLVRANYKTTIDYSYWSHGLAPLPGMTITLRVLPFVAADHRLYGRLFTPEQLGLSPERCAALAGKRGIVLGSHTTVFR